MSNRLTKGDCVFQSSPALSSGRYLAQFGIPSRYNGFNPRPPFRAGATGKLLHGARAEKVSILARPFERALRVTASASNAMAAFQSSPALSSGRYPLP